MRLFLLGIAAILAGTFVGLNVIEDAKAADEAHAAAVAQHSCLADNGTFTITNDASWGVSWTCKIH